MLRVAVAYTRIVLLLILLGTTLAAPFEATTLEKLRRATTDFSAPNGWKISWNVDGKRASTGPSTNTISFSTLATSGAITQAQVNSCVAKCSSTSGCGFVQIFQLSGYSSASVICSLHSAYVSTSSATYTTAPGSSSGSVVTTYGIRNLNTPVSGGGDTGGGSTAFPASPNGATLVQLKPCSRVSATIPMFVNNQYSSSSATSAYIVQHGASRNFQDYFTAVYNIIGTKGIIAAPNNYVTSDAAAPQTWFQPSVNLAWSPNAGTWTAGADAIGPSSGANALNGGVCSSYDTYDAILTYLNDKSRFPKLSKVYFVSHSQGAGMVSRYSQIYSGNYPFSFRYIVANAANQAYFTNARPQTGVCGDAYNYPSQLSANGAPRYVAARLTSPSAMFQRWISRDVVNLIGDLDTAARFPGGVQDCGSVAMGGADRRDRNYAWWAYINILAGTGADASNYYGYKQLIASGAKTLASGTFRHQNCVIDGVGHQQDPMFSSACGVAAMTQNQIPAGVGPLRP